MTAQVFTLSDGSKPYLMVTKQVTIFTPSAVIQISRVVDFTKSLILSTHCVFGYKYICEEVTAQGCQAAYATQDQIQARYPNAI